jgi:hypothetical protein
LKLFKLFKKHTLLINSSPYFLTRRSRLDTKSNRSGGRKNQEFIIRTTSLRSNSINSLLTPAILQKLKQLYTKKHSVGIAKNTDFFYVQKLDKKVNLAK